MDNYKFFVNKDCEYFPCHKTNDPEHFNCLFCYCPLYGLGPNCGGNFAYTDRGLKDCSACIRPHLPQNYEWVVAKFNEIAELAAKDAKHVTRSKTDLARMQEKAAASAEEDETTPPDEN